jgi:hypothetical protein
MRSGDPIANATEACTLGAGWVGAIKAGVETAPIIAPVPGGGFLDWMTEYWPELDQVVAEKDLPVMPHWYDGPHSMLSIILMLNEEWGDREKVAGWIEGLGY